jgi:hypothetical protein
MKGSGAAFSVERHRPQQTRYGLQSPCEFFVLLQRRYQR